MLRDDDRPVKRFLNVSFNVGTNAITKVLRIILEDILRLITQEYQTNDVTCSQE
jgi:hypothetical protein